MTTSVMRKENQTKTFWICYRTTYYTCWPFGMWGNLQPLIGECIRDGIESEDVTSSSRPAVRTAMQFWIIRKAERMKKRRPTIKDEVFARYSYDEVITY